MEAPDDRDRVRPLPPDSEPGDIPRAPNVRALLPMLAGGAILIAFILVLASGGVGGDDTVPGATDSTTTTRDFFRNVDPTTTIAVPTTIVTREAPLFGEVLPALADGLNVVVEDASGSASVARWRLNRRFPRFLDLPEGPGTSAFDASGSLVASLGTGNAGPSTRLLSIGPAGGGTRPAFVATFSFRWHDTTPGLLAVIGRQPDEESPGLYLVEVDAEGNVTGAARIIDADLAWRVAGFHDDRIAIEDFSGLASSLNTQSLGTLRLFDVTGAEIASTIGEAFHTSTSVLVGPAETEDGFAYTIWNWDLDDVTTSRRFLIDGLPAAISPNGLHGATVVVANTSTVVVRSEDFVVPRRIGVPASISRIMFFTDDHLAAFAESTGKFFVIQWRAGIVHEFELDGATIRAVAAPGFPPNHPSAVPLEATG